VFQVLSQDLTIYALKKVQVGMDEWETVTTTYANEINILKDLRGQPTVVHLVDYEIRKVERTIFLV
jgi:hypothetical protein